jgi:hypothetical protein
MILKIPVLNAAAEEAQAISVLIAGTGKSPAQSESIGAE